MSLSKCVHVCASESVFISVSVRVELWISVYFTIQVCLYAGEKKLGSQGDENQC